MCVRLPASALHTRSHQHTKMNAREILETGLYVEDLDAAKEFYTTVLGLQIMSDVPGRNFSVRCGGRVLLLFRADATITGAVLPPHGATGPGHLAFAAEESEMDDWRVHLRRSGVEIELDYSWEQGGRSLYFRDPAGNSLEIATPRLWGIADADALCGRGSGAAD